jgi:membrane carboxypeptidase/penicillin-binding protein
VWIGNDDYHRMNESYGGNIPARIWARFMKAALAQTPKHDFVLPAGEVKQVILCSTGKPEVFLAGTEPAHNCGTGEPATATTKTLPAVSPDQAGAIATPLAPRAAAPHAPAQPAVGDGTTFERLDTQPASPATP